MSASISLLAFRIYFFALRLAVRAVLGGAPLEGIKLLVASVGYWRFLPNAYVASRFLQKSNPVLLDIGSPKLLSIFLASQTSAPVYATDLDDERIFTRWKRLAAIRKLGNYVVEYQDARKLTYPDQTFDLLYSISVFEHIPDDGDILALRECQRVLKPGGVLVVEVPYRRREETVYAKYDSKGLPLEQPAFYERHYDSQLLEKRLQVPGLRLEQRLILGEWLPIDPWIATDRLPRLIRVALLPLEPWLAALNYWAREDDSKGRPLAALLVYRKS